MSNSVTTAQLEMKIRKAVRAAEGEAIGLKTLRRQLEEDFGLPTKALDSRKDEIKALLVQAMNADTDSEDTDDEVEVRGRGRSQAVHNTNTNSKRRGTVTDNTTPTVSTTIDAEPAEARGKDRTGQQADFEGFLKKRGDQGRLKMWRKRFFRLYKKEGVVAYFKNDTDFKQLGEISVVGAFLIDKRDDIAKLAFTITMKTTARVWILQGKDEATRESWINACAPLMKETIAGGASGEKKKKPPLGSPLRFPPTYLQGWEELDSCASTIQDKFDWTGLVKQSADQVALKDGDVAVTVHNGGDLAVVDEVRKLSLKDGETYLEDVPRQLKYTMNTVQWSGADSQLQQTRFIYDEKTQANLLNKLVGQKISVETPRSRDDCFPKEAKFTGVLYRHEDHEAGRYALVDEDNNSVHFLVPEEAVTINLEGVDRTSINAGGAVFQEPRLWTKFDGSASKPGQLTYSLKDAFDLHVNYAITLNSDESKADINGWYSVNNKSSKTFKNARLAVMPTPTAPDVADVEEGEDEASMAEKAEALAKEEGKKKATSKIPGGLGGLASLVPGVGGGDDDDDKEPRIYHYPVVQDVTLPSNDWAHASFLSARVASRAMHLVSFDTPRYQIKPSVDAGTGADAAVEVNTVIRFNNPLKDAIPSGKAKINRRELWGHGARQVSATVIERVEGGETVTINLETAAGISATRKQTGYNFDAEKHFMIETFEITLVNGRQELCEINVEDSMYRWQTYEITSSWPKFSPTAHPRRIGWNIKLNSGEDITIKYTVFYSEFELPSDYE